MAGMEIRNVSKSYPGTGRPVEALRGIDLAVTDGEFVAIVGPSGCGKSTLLYVIGGFIDCEGEVSVDGRRITGPGTDRGIVFQEQALFPWLTVRRNILYGPETRRVPVAEREREADRLIATIGLRGFEDRFPRELSGGMRQRVALARTLACNPAILLLDEPFGALDAQTREFMQDELMRIWHETRKTVLMITHDVDEAVYLAGRVLVMSARPGRLVEEFEVDLDRSRPREDIVLSDRFRDLRNQVWLSVRRQAQRPEAAARGGTADGTAADAV